MNSIDLQTDEAKALYMAILNYFLFCDDPAYSRLHKMRNNIIKIENKEDRQQLVNYFEMETRQSINYFTNPY